MRTIFAFLSLFAVVLLLAAPDVDATADDQVQLVLADNDVPIQLGATTLGQLPSAALASATVHRLPNDASPDQPEVTSSAERPEPLDRYLEPRQRHPSGFG